MTYFLNNCPPKNKKTEDETCSTSLRRDSNQSEISKENQNNYAFQQPLTASSNGHPIGNLLLTPMSIKPLSKNQGLVSYHQNSSIPQYTPSSSKANSNHTLQANDSCQHSKAITLYENNNSTISVKNQVDMKNHTSTITTLTNNDVTILSPHQNVEKNSIIQPSTSLLVCQINTC